MHRVDEFLNSCIIVDTETTSKDYRAAEVIEFASVGKIDGEWKVIHESLYKPTVSILPEISAVTHIADKHVQDCVLFKDGNDTEKEIFNSVLDGALLLVAHNAPYDKGVMNNYDGFSNCNDRWLCTMRVAKRLYMEDETVTQFNLQYLRYRFDLDIPENINPHRASSDCIVTAKLLEYLVGEIHGLGILDETRPYKDQIIEWASQPVFIPKMNFGKHAGQKWDDIPTDYIVWAINNLDCLREENPLYDPDMVHTILTVMDSRL